MMIGLHDRATKFATSLCVSKIYSIFSTAPSGVVEKCSAPWERQLQGFCKLNQPKSTLICNKKTWLSQESG